MKTDFRLLCACVVAFVGLALLLSVTMRRSAPRTRLELEISGIESLGGHVSKSATDIDVAFCNKDIGESHIKALAGLRELRDLDLSYSRLADPELSFLERLPAIRSLDVNDTNITPGAFCAVAGCPSIKYLYAMRTRVDDSSMSAIASLPELRKLYLDGTAIGDSGLITLRQARQLEVLSIEDTHVTDSGVSSLVKCLPHLKCLRLRRCPVGPQTMREVGKLPGLTSLNLEGTQVTDEDLVWLGGLKKLEELDVANTNVTAGAVAALNSKLPALESLRTDANKVERK